jgi:tetrapyrrole methylase family protein/MazG family protein
MDFQNLLQIMETLRSEKGCPWDKEQTRETLKLFILEEAYELIDAINGNNPEQIKEELGDLLFQIIFQSQIAKEKGEFAVSDVIEKICNKMVARHPHVFGKAYYKTADEVLLNWEKQKRLEGKLRESVLEGIPDSLPSLLRAYKLQHRAARVGFDWVKVEDVIEKLDEEIKEFKEAIKAKDKENMSQGS